MNEIILGKCGELALKGLNRAGFENILIKNLRKALAPHGDFDVSVSQSTVYMQPFEGADMDGAFAAAQRVFGLSALSRAGVFEKDIDTLLREAPQYLRDEMERTRTFKVEAKRSDKSFPLKSPEICRELGAALLGAFPHLKVDVNRPGTVVTAEIREKGAYVHAGQLRGAGGLPTGTSGKGAVLISGGIDSPVAAWMMARRGMRLSAVHFASPPYTSERAEKKVISLLGAVSRYAGDITLYIVPFTKIQEEIGDRVHEEFSTLVMRRFMMKAASRIAAADGASVLITGESLGQVASQTLPSLCCTEEAARLPVFRPLIGMDKEEIVRISRQIGAFETSILPYEDCCTVFTPKHPKTRPQLAELLGEESRLDGEALISEAVAGVRKVIIE